MREDFPQAADSEPVREVGRLMARQDLDLVPIVDTDGELAGVMTERALARRYIRESREPSELDAPTQRERDRQGARGRAGGRRADAEVSGQIWCMAMDVGALPSGDRARATWSWSATATTRSARRSSSASGCWWSPTARSRATETLALAAERGVPVVTSPLDSYVTARMVTLSAPCRALMDPDPLTVRPDDLLSDVADEVKEVHYRAAVAVDARRHPIGLVTRTDLLTPQPRRVLLVDHAEQAQSVLGVEQAEIVEILDHHHIGSIETTVPVRATFDPVGSTSTLVIERFRQNGMEPSRSTATLLLVRDHVGHGHPQLADDDRARPRRRSSTSQRVLALDADGARARDVRAPPPTSTGVAADAIVSRDLKEYEVPAGRRSRSRRWRPSARARRPPATELLEAMDAGARAQRLRLYALMVTDILAKDTDLYVSGDPGPLESAFEHRGAWTA